MTARKKARGRSTAPARPSTAAELRRGAEARLRQHRGAARPRGGVPQSTSDVRRLLHELQVHQVELEMQNAELQEARDRGEALLEKFSDLYDFAPVGYFTLDEQGRIREVNLTGAALLGVERSLLIDQRIQHFVTPMSRPGFRRFLAQAFAGSEKSVCEAKLRRPDGREFWADLHAAGAEAREAQPRSCRVTVSDITALKRSEESERRVEALAAANEEANREIARRRVVEAALRKSEQAQRELLAEAHELHVQLRRLARQILRAQEEERRQISRELHDEIAQVLAGITVQLTTLTHAVSLRAPDLRKRVRRAQRLVVQSIDVVHRFARELRPTMLDDLGLIPALRAYIRDLPGRKGLRVRFTAAAGVEALDNTRRTVLYRVAQEALTNVTRHAEARIATVQLRAVRNAVRLVVHDDGKSFPAAGILASNTGKRLGLLGMRERVEMVGGSFAIESAPGRGTTVRAEIPVRSPRRRSTAAT